MSASPSQLRAIARGLHAREVSGTRWPAPRGTPGGLPALPERREQGFVYFIRLGDDGPVKIGWALDPKRRLGELQIGNPIRLKLLAFRRGTRARERQLHARFMAYRVQGEWYRWNAGIRDLLRPRRPRP